MFILVVATSPLFLGKDFFPSSFSTISIIVLFKATGLSFSPWQLADLRTAFCLPECPDSVPLPWQQPCYTPLGGKWSPLEPTKGHPVMGRNLASTLWKAAPLSHLRPLQRVWDKIWEMRPGPQAAEEAEKEQLSPRPLTTRPGWGGLAGPGSRGERAGWGLPSLLECHQMLERHTIGKTRRNKKHSPRSQSALSRGPCGEDI